MYVKNAMSANPFYVSTDTSVSDAFEIMKENNISKLPVLSKNKLVGIVTRQLLLKVSPSSATTLSIFEMNYLLSKTKISEVMEKKVLTISPDAFIEEAALIMSTKDVGSLVVVEGEKMVGIVTKKDIFNAFIEIMGFKDNGSRIVLAIKDSPGQLAKISAITANHNINIIHLSIYKDELIFTVNTKNTTELIKDLKKEGF